MSETEREALSRAEGYFGKYDPSTRIAYSYFCDGAEWKEEKLLEKIKEYLDSILVYDNVGDLKFYNIKSYDELINDIEKQVFNHEV